MDNIIFSSILLVFVLGAFLTMTIKFIKATNEMFKYPKQ